MAETPSTGPRKPTARLGRGLDSLTAGGKLRQAEQDLDPQASMPTPHPALAQPRERSESAQADASNAPPPEKNNPSTESAATASSTAGSESSPIRNGNHASQSGAGSRGDSFDDIERLRREVHAAQRQSEIAQQISGEARIQLVLMHRRQRVWATAVLALMTLLGLLVWWASAEIQQRQLQLEQLQAWGGAGSVPAPTVEQGEQTGVDVAALRSERDRLRSELRDTRKALEAANSVMDELSNQGRGKPAAR